MREVELAPGLPNYSKISTLQTYYRNCSAYLVACLRYLLYKFVPRSGRGRSVFYQLDGSPVWFSERLNELPHEEEWVEYLQRLRFDRMTIWRSISVV